jgi:hypothetical protein
MIAHDTPAILDARPNLLKLSESASLNEVLRGFAGSGPRAKTFECVGKENARAKQTQTRCNRFNHRKFPLRPGLDTTTRHRAQSKEFLAGIENQAGVMLWHNRFVNGELRNRARRGGLGEGSDPANPGNPPVRRSNH